MTDPARWAWLNESEREVLRIAHSLREPGRWIDADMLIAAADAITSDDPPQVEIEMPEGWALDTDDGLLSSDDTALILGETGCEVQLQETEGDIPFAVMAIALRSAGWRVEAPR